MYEKQANLLISMTKAWSICVLVIILSDYCNLQLSRIRTQGWNYLKKAKYAFKIIKI